MTTGIAILRVGGVTEVEAKEKKSRVDDAMHATRAAIEEGIVPGGGVALIRAENAVAKLQHENMDVRAGIDIVRRALESPLRQICENAGAAGSIVVSRVHEARSSTFGFDAASERYVDMIEAGILDPAKVVRTALQDAASVASLFITSEACIAARSSRSLLRPATPQRRVAITEASLPGDPGWPLSGEGALSSAP